MSFSPLQKQQAMLQAAVVSESDLTDTEIDLQVLDVNALEFGDEVLGYEVEEASGLKLKDNRIEVEERGAFLTLKTNSANNVERYFSLANLWYEGEKNSYITITDGSRSKNLEIKSSLDNAYANIHNFLCNLGYADCHNDTWRIMFSEPGTYTFDSIEIIDQSLGNMEDWIGRRKETETDYSFAEDRILADVNLNEDELLYVSVPYSKGWQAYVDGEKEEIIRVNHFGLGLLPGQGEHRIEFVYHTPYMRVGVGLMVLGIICCIAISLREAI